MTTALDLIPHHRPTTLHISGWADPPVSGWAFGDQLLMEPEAGYQRQSCSVEHRFTLVLDRLPAPAELASYPPEVRAWCGPGVPVRLQLRWPAPSLAAAVAAAVRCTEVAGLRVWRVDGTDLVTLAEIARRVGRCRETVRLWSTGELGPGGFPPPLNPGRATAIYSWSEIVPWLTGPADRCAALADRDLAGPVLAAAELALRLRAMSDQLADPLPIWELLMPS